MRNKTGYVCMLLGAILAFSRGFFDEKYRQIVLVLGMGLLVLGIYTLSKSLPSKQKEAFEDQEIKEEKE